MTSADLWLLDGSLVREDDLGFFAQQLGASEARRYCAFSRAERKRQFLLGRMLLRFVVSSLLSLPPDVLGVVERVRNAPQLVLPDAKSAPASFSLAHSAEWVACAISANAILGIDIECNDSRRNILAVSQMAFHAKEHFWLLRQSEAARLSAFYQLWCAREALYKLMSALGRDSGALSLVSAEGVLTSQGDGWCCYRLAHLNLTIALCGDRPLSALRKIELKGLGRADWLALGRESTAISEGGIDGHAPLAPQ